LREPDLDSTIKIIENPVRRKIIERLSQEPAYPLQISQELGIGQQLVTKHLEAMEKSGLVTSIMIESPTGPKRRLYALSKSISITVDFAPNLFNARILAFDTMPSGQSSPAASLLLGRVDKTTETSDVHGKIAIFAKILQEIDKKMMQLEDERAVLLYIRNAAMREASRAITKTEARTDRKRVLHYILDQHSRDIEGISKSLHLREADVREIVADLKKIV
jgi:predicted transcriptional regulator